MIDVLDALSDSELSADSSIVLTYEVQLPLYDGWVRRRLSAAGAGIQLVFCDLGPYQRELNALSVARHCGHSYVVAPVHQKGAFHPKVYLLLGRRRGRMVVGSGNSTVGGLVRNAELFCQFDYDAELGLGPHPAFSQILDLTRSLAEHAPSVVLRQFENAVALAPWLHLPALPDDRTLLISGPGRRPMLDQMDDLVGGRKVESIAVVSSSFDRRLTGLKRLGTRWGQVPVHCIVQPELAHLDGDSVRILGSAVRWTQFVDPYPKEKRGRRDTRVHAKLLILTCEEEELVIWGSANASRPALVEPENLEVAVAHWRPAGFTVDELNLAESLKSEDVYNLLVSKEWTGEEEPEAERLSVVLLGAAEESGRLVLTLAPGQTTSAILVEISEGVNRPPLLRLPATIENTSLSCDTEGALGSARVVRLVDGDGAPLSNYVAITWQDFGERRGSSGLSGRVQSAIGAMQDGIVLGTVLFELLSGIRDFDVVLAPAGTRRRPADQDGAEENEGEQSHETRPESSYYADARPSSNFWEASPTGDRADLDLLASLVQPIGPPNHSDRLVPDRDTDEDVDDAKLDEEAERRAIDAKGGRATGKEGKGNSTLATAVSLKRAAGRLARRLDTASRSAEQRLGELQLGKALPPRTLARQIWMAQIGAFLCGRRTTSVESTEVLCLEPRVFAGYLVRICRALAGGKEGGLLRRLPPTAWEGRDGDSLRRGLRFLWSCAVWATEYFESCGPHARLEQCEALAGIVVARFVAEIRKHLDSMDTDALARRLPAVDQLPVGALERQSKRLHRLADFVTRCDALGVETTAENPVRAGMLAFHPVLGLTIVLDGDRNKAQLADLSRLRLDGRRFTDFFIAVRHQEWDAATIAKQLSSCSR